MIITDDRLVAFLFLLMRDYVPFGIIPKIIMDLNKAPCYELGYDTSVLPMKYAEEIRGCFSRNTRKDEASSTIEASE